MIREITDEYKLGRAGVEQGEKYYIGDVCEDEDGKMDYENRTVNWFYRIHESVRIEEVVGNEEKYYFSDEGSDDEELDILVDKVWVDKATGNYRGPFFIPLCPEEYYAQMGITA